MWAIGIDRWIFPLCSSTTFQLNLDESTKILQSSGLYVLPSSCRSSSTSLQLTNMPSLENSDDDCCISCTTLYHLAVTNSVPVGEKPRVPPEFSKDWSLIRSLISDCNIRWGTVSSGKSGSTFEHEGPGLSSGEVLVGSSSRWVHYWGGLGSGTESSCSTGLRAEGILG